MTSPLRALLTLRGRSFPLLLAVALLAALGPVPDTRADEDPQEAGEKRAPANKPVAVPVGRPVQLDGKVIPAEWSPATTLKLGGGKAELRLMQYRGTLLVAFQSAMRWTPGATLTLYFAWPDTPGGSHGKRASSIQYEPFAHDRGHVFAFHNGEEGFLRVVDKVVARSQISLTGSALEMALPLSFLGLSAEETPPLRFCAFWSQPNARGSSWPAGLDFLGTRARSRPPALLETKAWGTLEGWTDPAGFGAFEPAAWQAWLEEDREVTHRGRDAHAEVRLLVEEWKETSKRDSEFEKSVLDELDWLATKEALTPGDLIAKAIVLRFLNRHDEALGLWDALVQSPQPGPAKYARWQRAKTLEAASRFAEAAEEWTTLAADAQGMVKTQNTQRAQWARAQQEKWDAEKARRVAGSAAGDRPLVALQTNRGLILIELCVQDVPNAVAHFLELVETGFYDGTCFHRVHGEFMAQGGDPKSRELGCSFAGGGTSGKQIEVEINPRHGLWRGAVAFANKTHDPRNGSQFFLMSAARPDLKTYTVFGYVIAGQGAVDRLEVEDKLERAYLLKRVPPKAAPGTAGSKKTSPPAKTGKDR